MFPFHVSRLSTLMKLIPNSKHNLGFNTNKFLQNNSIPEEVHSLSMECTSQDQLYPKFSRFDHQCSIKGMFAKRFLHVESKVYDHLDSFQQPCLSNACFIMLDARTQSEDVLIHASESLLMDNSISIQRKRNNNLRGKGKINKALKIVENIKGQWSHAEDMILTDLVKKHGARGWSRIAEMLPGRVGKQCRERWQNHLRPDIKKGGWSEEEDKLLITLHKEVGNKWSEIAKRLPWRSENTIKNHFNATKRRQPSPKNNRTRNAKRNNNLLQNYIRTTLSSSSSSSLRNSSNSKNASSFETILDNNRILISHPDAEGSSSLESKLGQQVSSSLEAKDYHPTVRFSSDQMSWEEYSANSILGENSSIPFGNVFDDHLYNHDMPYDLSMALMELETKRENDFVATAFQDFVGPF